MASLSFSDTTNKNGIIQTCEALCNLGDTGISGDSQLLKEFTRYVNKTMSDIWTTIFFAYAGWQYDDSNQTDLPSAVDTLTQDKTSYALPAGIHGVRAVEVKDTGGYWRALIPMPEELIRQRQAVSEWFKVSSIPLYYQLVGDSVRIFPPANYTQASSFKVFLDREMTTFASTDTTKVPGFPSAFHDAVPVGASIEWMKIHRADSPILAKLEYEYNGTPIRIRMPINEFSWKKKIERWAVQRLEQLFPPRFTTADYTLENL